MNIIVSMETRSICAAVIEEGGSYVLPGCTLNEELRNPGVLVVMDRKRRILQPDRKDRFEPVTSKYICFGDGTGGILHREHGDDLAALAVPRYIPDPDIGNEPLWNALNQAKSLVQLRQVAERYKYPPADAFPTTEELRDLYARRVDRDKKLIALGDARFAEDLGNLRGVPGQCRDALVRLGIHRPWETFAEIDAIEAQKKFLENLNPTHPLAAAKRMAA